MKKLLVLICLLASCTSRHEIKKDDALFSISLKDLQDKPFQLSLPDNSKVLVLLFLSPDCPICQSYSLTLRNLFDAYKDKAVSFTGIIPGTDYTNASLENYRNTYQLPFNLVVDEKKELTHYLKATVTPQCYVINADGKILYSGKIDDYAVSPGVTRQQVTQHYLADALNAVVANEKIAVTKTEPAGCFIER